MKRFFLYLSLALYSSALFGQAQDKRLTFILIIDDELPVTDITNGIFLFKDSAGTIKDKISFDYKVGGLLMSSSDYKKLLSPNPEHRIFIKFKHIEFRPHHVEYTYEKEIPNGWINKEYIIFRVFNASNKVNRTKYFFKQGEEYLIQIKIPGSSTLLITRKQ